VTERVRVLVGLVVCSLLLGLAVARAGLPGIPGIPPVPKPPVPKVPQLPSLPIPDVTQLLNGEDAVSTTFADAVPNIAFLNDYQPLNVDFLDERPRTSSGGYEVPAGSYIFDGRSYCLHPGKHGLVTGAGYQWAPIKGSKAQIVQTILQKSADHLEIPQREIQQLLWAVQARARFANLDPELQVDAAKLLTPVQILSLNQSAIGVVPDDKLEALMAKIPDPLKAEVQAENSLRSMLTSNATYEDMERVAVLPNLNQPETNLPPVRWSFAPSGFFVWFIPTGYSATTMVIDVPGAVTLTQDALGRVTSLQDRRGNSIGVSYDTSRSGELSVAGDAQTHLYKITDIRFVWKQMVNGRLSSGSQSLPVQQWVAVGVPSGKGHAAGPADTQTIYEDAQSLGAQFNSLLSSAHGAHSALGSLVAVAQLQQALAAARRLQPIAAGAIFELQFPYQAWESAFAHSMGGHLAADVDTGQDAPIELWLWLAMPDFPIAQRLGQSEAPQQPMPPPEAPQQPMPPQPCPQLPPHQGNPMQQAIATALAEGGYPGAAKDSSQIAIALEEPSNVYPSNVYFEENLDAGGNPVAPCAPGVYKITGVVGRLLQSQGPLSWTEWYAIVSIFNSGVLVGEGTGTDGSPNSPGSMVPAIAAATQEIHPIPTIPKK
jgi:hypothetical protein